MHPSEKEFDREEGQSETGLHDSATGCDECLEEPQIFVVPLMSAPQ